MEHRATVSKGTGLDFVLSDASLDRHGTRINPGGIYEITNLLNGNRYIGSAKNFAVRWRAHRSKLRNGKHANRYLQAAWNKYGEAAFVFSELLRCAPGALIAEEQAQIDARQPEYNLSPTAGSSLGVVFSEEARRKVSAAMKGKAVGRKRDAVSVEKTAAAHRGMTRSAETREKISAAKKGRKRDPLAVERTAAALRGRNLPPERVAHLLGNSHALGTRHTDEWKRAASERQMGRPSPKSAEHRAKISAAIRGVPHSAERRAATSARMIGKKRGPYKVRQSQNDAIRRSDALVQGDGVHG